MAPALRYPGSGGNTSRFVDSSLQRLELKANTAFLQSCSLRLNGRELPLGDGWLGLRYRHSRLYPSLHPCIDPHLPLRLEISGPAADPARFQLGAEGSDRISFEPNEAPDPKDDWGVHGAPWPAPAAGLRTLDLRLA